MHEQCLEENVENLMLINLKDYKYSAVDGIGNKILPSQQAA